MAADGSIGASGEWCTIESDPGVFTALIESFGVRNAELSELWSLDDDSLKGLLEGGKVYGLIFLFKWVAEHHKKPKGGEAEVGAGDGGGTTGAGEEEQRGKALVGDEAPPSLFFAHQVTTNACATQAILSVLLNAAADAEGGGKNDTDENKMQEDGNDEDNNGTLILGPTLTNLQSFISTFPPSLRGEAIGASDEIRTAHNSFARSEGAFLSDPEERKKRVAGEDDDVFHFVAYVPHKEDGCVYELDGLREGPIRCGKYDETGGGGSSSNQKCGGDDDDMAWLSVARAAVQERIERYAATEVKFNLMAVVHDRRSGLECRLRSLKEAGMDDDSAEMEHVRAALVREEEKRARWKVENERRRHNYLPFCVELLRGLAGSGKLPALTEKANERMVESRKKAMAATMAKMGAAAGAGAGKK